MAPPHTVRRLSTPEILESGDIKAFVHAEDPRDLEFLTEDVITNWPRELENEGNVTDTPYKVMIRRINVESKDLYDLDVITKVIEELVGLNVMKFGRFMRLIELINYLRSSVHASVLCLRRLTKRISNTTASRINSLTTPDDIRDIHWYKDYRPGSQVGSAITHFGSHEKANDDIVNGIF